MHGHYINQSTQNEVISNHYLDEGQKWGWLLVEFSNTLDLPNGIIQHIWVAASLSMTLAVYQASDAIRSFSTSGKSKVEAFLFSWVPSKIKMSNLM